MTDDELRVEHHRLLCELGREGSSPYTKGKLAACNRFRDWSTKQLVDSSLPYGFHWEQAYFWIIAFLKEVDKRIAERSYPDSIYTVVLKEVLEDFNLE